MKQIKTLSIVLLVISILIFGAYKGYEYKTQDNTPPVIYCDLEELVVSVSVTEEELLEGLYALDAISGDVTDTLVVEKISPFTEENTRIITYAAIDAKGNVGRLTRTLVYTDYETPKFTLSQPLRVPMGKTINLLKTISASSVVDGDLTDRIKYSLESTINVSSTGVYEIVFRVTDSCGHVEYLPLEVEVYDGMEEKLKVTLTDYLVYHPLNEEFDPMKYYEGSEEEGDLYVISRVNIEEEGVYYVDYELQSPNSQGKTRLVVVVKEL